MCAALNVRHNNVCRCNCRHNLWDFAGKVINCYLSHCSSHCIAYNSELLMPCVNFKVPVEGPHPGTENCWFTVMVSLRLIYCNCIMWMGDVYITLLIHLKCPPLSWLDLPIIDSSLQQPSANSLTEIKGSTPNSVLLIFAPAMNLVFRWGSIDSESFCHPFEATYCEIFHWKINSLKVPSGVLTEAKPWVGKTLSEFKATFTMCTLLTQNQPLHLNWKIISLFLNWECYFGKVGT